MLGAYSDHSARLRPAPVKLQTSARSCANDGGHAYALPESDGAVLAARGDQPPVAAVSDALHGALGTGKWTAQLRPGRDVPESYRSVFAAGGERAADGAEGNAPHQARVAGQRTHEGVGACADPPEPDGVIGASGGEQTSVGREGQVKMSAPWAIRWGSSGISVCASHSRMALPSPPAATRVPSGLKATAKTAPKLPVSGRPSSVRVRTSHRRTVPSAPPETSLVPVWSKAIEYTAC